jgi:glucose/arabinose dehydrogenase
MLARYVVVSWLLLLVHSGPALAQLRRATYVTGLAQPVAFVQDPSDSSVQYVVQQGGLVRVVLNGTLQTTPFLDLRTVISSGGERGLLGIAFPPDYAVSGRFYVDFTNPSGDIVVARFKRSGGTPLVADPASRFDIRWSTGERVIRHPLFSNHNGGTLQFGPDGYLYVAVGDGGSSNDPNHNAQNMASLLGKLLRIDVSVPDGNPAGRAIPPDNPFPSGAAPEIWDIGLRNPWKFSFDDPFRGGTGALVIGDVGQNAWEEIDYEPPARGGNNYGWRNREGAHDNVTSLPPAFQPLVDPTYEYSHAVGASVTGGYVYRGTALGAAFRGRYVFADFVAAKIWSLALTIDPGTGRATASDLRDHSATLTPGNVSSFGVDAAGELYFVDYSNGAIVRIDAAPGSLDPAMAFDMPTPDQTLAQPVSIAGWALDPAAAPGAGAGIDAIHVWAFPLPAFGAPPSGPPVFVGATTLTIDRPDVAAVFGSPQFTRSGFLLLATGLRPGFYTLAAFGHVQSTGRFDVVRLVDINVVLHTFISVGLPTPGSTVGSTIGIGGWAFDAAAPTGSGVDAIHAWAFSASSTAQPVFLGATTTFLDRPDVGAVFGAQFTTSGFSLNVNSPPPGVWDLYVFARSTVTGQFQPSAPVRITR